MRGAQPTDEDGHEQDGTPAGRPAGSRWWAQLWTERRRPIVITSAIAVVALTASGLAVGYGLTSAQADADRSSAVAATETPTPSPTSSPTEPVTATATPTPIPTRTPIAVPTPTPFPTDAAPAVIPFDPPTRPERVLPLGCDGLVPESVRIEALGDAGHLLDTGGPAQDDMIAAEWQAGLLRCIWDNAAHSASLVLTVLPDGLSDFRTYSTTTFGGYGSDQLGPDSRVTCGLASNPSVWGCRGGFVPAGDWVEFNFGGLRPGVPAAEVVLGHLADAVTASLTAAGPSRAVGPLPSGTPRGWTDCSQFDGAGLRSAMNAPALAPWTDNWALDMTTTANQRMGLVDCNWRADSGLTRLTVSLLPGGGWSVPDAATASAEYPTGTSRIVAVDGAEAAELTCFPAYGNCILRASVRGSLLTVTNVTGAGAGRDAATDALTAARFLIAHLPA